MGHDSCRADPGNDVWNRRTWGICEICILTETAKISRRSQHPELAKIPTSPVSRLLQIQSLQTWDSWAVTVRSASQLAEGAFPVPVAATAALLQAVPASAPPANTVPRATRRHRLTACPIPEVFFPSPLDMVSRLHWGLSCGVSPKFSISASLPRACMGASNVTSSWLVSAFLRCVLVRLASHSTECLIQSLVK